jgi:hypothetical protein
MSILQESEIPDIFDELETTEDSHITMRTIVDFSLFSNQGYLISIEDLGKIGTTASLVGHVIEPLPSEIRQAMVDLSCTSQQDLPSEEELAKLLPLAQKRRKSISASSSGVNASSEGYQDYQLQEQFENEAVTKNGD